MIASVSVYHKWNELEISYASCVRLGTSPPLSFVASHPDLFADET